jgi:hypothetical protein
MQHPDETFANIRMKHMKTLETYACNMHVYATSRSTFANFQIKHLQHLSRTDKTFGTYI